MKPRFDANDRPTATHNFLIHTTPISLAEEANLVAKETLTRSATAR